VQQNYGNADAVVSDYGHGLYTGFSFLFVVAGIGGEMDDGQSSCSRE
jgi:hypothetical protein